NRSSPGKFGPPVVDHHLVRKLHWLLISRLVMVAGLLAIVWLTEGDNTRRSFIPVLGKVAVVVVALSVVYLGLLRTQLPNKTQSYIQFSLNLGAISAVAVLSSHLAGRIRRSETQLASATRDLADYRLFNDRIIESMRSGLVTTDLEGRIITFNRAAEEITGYRAADVRGEEIFAIFGDIGNQIEAGLESIRTRT